MNAWKIMALALFVLTSIAFAQNPIGEVTTPLQEQINTLGQQLPQKAAQHILEGNLTQEHISQDLNATTEQLEQKAKDELKNQLNKKVQPGFECAFALAGILSAALILRRRH